MKYKLYSENNDLYLEHYNLIEFTKMVKDFYLNEFLDWAMDSTLIVSTKTSVDDVLIHADRVHYILKDINRVRYAETLEDLYEYIDFCGHEIRIMEGR